MKEFEFVVTDPQGIHARPAGLLVKEAKKFESNISVFKGARKGNLKKIFTVMALGVKQGETIKVQVEGADEEQAASTVEAFLKENF
ncbi:MULTISPECIES: HPr family phosphocarrier protein [unclassified Megasphaera]|jgi:phosphocarrier protein HPr|uniref:HPr family phosphocarrier protein n=1 Tax=unclassified Megasphaera TaxID=2626256 RepID=UPI0003571EDF|nr:MULTISPECIES: HPr family phosphocarrier protein [unclassified Megasphaera]EPP16842.1 phosphocarrier protein HPr [Megasphaera sp. BL7]EPP18386.1 phosphocarrier protein HPr [Megasphaera sp. NM10]MBS7222273.1 HPr family phosphocarrier protein [Megasphaera sp.]